jgi:hypothetical protein
MFQILSMTEARLATLTPRAQKHGDEEVPAVSLGLELTVANTLLDCIDPAIRQTLYKAVEGQDQLPGVEPATPVLRCNSFEKHTLPRKYEGWTLQVDDGIDDTQPMTFSGCKVDKLSIEAQQGGSVILRLRVGTSDLDAERSGMLGMHVGQSIWITLTAPEKQPDAIDGTTAAFEADHPEASDMFAAAHADGEVGDGGTDDDGPEDGEDDEGGVDVTGSAEKWPFPKDAPNEAPPQGVTIETSRPGTRTARGREKTKAALEAGMKAAGTVQ